jgi:hypothetical protein
VGRPFGRFRGGGAKMWKNKGEDKEEVKKFVKYEME